MDHREEVISWLLAPAHQRVLYSVTKLCTPGCATLGEPKRPLMPFNTDSAGMATLELPGSCLDCSSGRHTHPWRPSTKVPREACKQQVIKVLPLHTATSTLCLWTPAATALTLYAWLLSRPFPSQGQQHTSALLNTAQRMSVSCCLFPDVAILQREASVSSWRPVPQLTYLSSRKLGGQTESRPQCVS